MMSQSSCLAFVSCFCFHVCIYVVLGSSYKSFVLWCSFSSPCMCVICMICTLYVGCPLSSLHLFFPPGVGRDKLLPLNLLFLICLSHFRLNSGMQRMSHLLQSPPAPAPNLSLLSVKVKRFLPLSSWQGHLKVLLDHLGCSLPKFLGDRRHQVANPLAQLTLPILQVVVLGGYQVVLEGPVLPPLVAFVSSVVVR